MAKKEKSLMDEIKMMEDEAREKAMEKAAADAPASESKDKIDFDMWHMQKSSQIPGHHMKEILWADFKARGLSNKETAEDYNKALAKYGIKLQ